MNRRLHWLLYGTAAWAVTVSSGLSAGDHWLSGVRSESALAPSTFMPATRARSTGAATLMSTSSTAVFDITISLDSDPQGDDVYPDDSGTDDDDQNAYEERIEGFARAVYESTNGAHKIGKVTIFRNRDFRSTADVRWDENCPEDEGPRAHPSGFKKPGKYLWMCTNWPGAPSLMPTAKGSGYTLAHEWGHYAYGLYDEYASGTCDSTTWEGSPCSTDTVADPSIMYDQWTAARTPGDARYLEFSTQNIEPYKSTSTGTNAQKRVFGKSGWETLTQDPKSDPKFSWLPSRTQYTGLTAPSAPNWIVANNDPDSVVLSELDIRWAGEPVLDLSIDVSGSMGGTPLGNAKTGANLLIDQIRSGSAIGVQLICEQCLAQLRHYRHPEPGHRHQSGRTGGRERSECRREYFALRRAGILA